MLYYIGSATFIGLKLLSNIGYWNIGKISYRCNTNYGQTLVNLSGNCPVSDHYQEHWNSIALEFCMYEYAKHHDKYIVYTCTVDTSLIIM